jgi:hypothetical protein
VGSDRASGGPPIRCLDELTPQKVLAAVDEALLAKVEAH